MDDYEGFYGLSLVLLEFFLGEKFVCVLVLRTLLVLRTVALLIKFNRFKKRAYKLLAEYSATKLFFPTFLFLAVKVLDCNYFDYQFLIVLMKLNHFTVIHMEPLLYIEFLCVLAGKALQQTPNNFCQLLPCQHLEKVSI
jgi:hypothetical protein